MLTLGFLALSAALAPLAILFVLGRFWTLEVAYIRLAWIPVAALVVQVILWRPMTQALSYAFIVLPLLTGIVSLFFGTVGATLLVQHSWAERRPGLLLSAVLASVPGAVLVTWIAFSFISYLLKG